MKSNGKVMKEYLLSFNTLEYIVAVYEITKVYKDNHYSIPGNDDTAVFIHTFQGRMFII